uniref:Uncharacterized protein n=1 Tax=Parastrongyloides trichosuri TaxID=131310 RepID=A0A0N4ZF75_PARTI
MKSCTTKGYLTLSIILVALLEIVSRNLFKNKYDYKIKDVANFVNVSELSNKTQVYVYGEQKTEGYLLFDSMGCSFSSVDPRKINILEAVSNISLIVVTRKGYIDVCYKINKNAQPLLTSSKTLMELTAIFGVSKFLLVAPLIISNSDKLRLFPFIFSLALLHAIGTTIASFIISMLKINFYEIIGMTKYEATEMNHLPSINTNPSYTSSIIVDLFSHLLFIILISFAWRKRNCEMKEYGSLSSKLISKY